LVQVNVSSECATDGVNVNARLPASQSVRACMRAL
jgi:hypothetical protein